MSKSILNVLVFSAFLFQACKTSSRKDSCNDFKAGLFHYTQTHTGISYSVTRSDSTQIEINSETREKTEARIKWLSDCEYELYYFNSIEGRLNKPVRFKILKTESGGDSQTSYNYCVFEPSMPGNEQKFIDTLWKHNSED